MVIILFLFSYFHLCKYRLERVVSTAREKIFENKIKKYIESKGGYQLKYWAGSQFTKAGIPDLLCCINGYFVAIEVKAQNGKPSELQLYTIEQIRKAGGFAFVLYPSAWEQFTTFVEGLYKDTFIRKMPTILK